MFADVDNLWSVGSSQFCILLEESGDCFTNLFSAVNFVVE